jgi:hypothetical protein
VNAMIGNDLYFQLSPTGSYGRISEATDFTRRLQIQGCSVFALWAMQNVQTPVLLIIHHDLADRLSVSQSVKGLVKFVERNEFTEKFVYGEFASFVKGNKAWYIPGRHTGTKVTSFQSALLGCKLYCRYGEPMIGMRETRGDRGAPSFCDVEGQL